MNDPVRISKNTFLLGLVLVAGLLGGCASKAPAPVRDGSGAASAPPAAAMPRQDIHIVRQGETLLSISRQYGQSVRDLVQWNNLGDPNQIQVGQELRIASQVGATDVAVATPLPVSPEPVVVAPSPSIEPMPGAAIKQGPLGGKQAYSDEAWARLQPQPTPPVEPPATPVENVPPATPSTKGEPAKGGEAAEGEWLWPAKGRVLAGFNEATNKGVDIAGNPGDPVLASAAGKVAYAGSGLRGYGKLVIIKHESNYLTAYAHNQQLLVKEGDAVTKGQKIAELGSTDTDRPKLHFEIRKQGRPVDPMKYLPAR